MNLMQPSDIAKYSLIPINYNFDEIVNIVRIVEQTKIIPLIGIDKYNELLTTRDEEILSYIFPYEGMCLIEQSAPYLAYRINEQGITKSNSEYSSTLSLDELNYLVSYARSQSNELLTTLIDYLKEKNLYKVSNTKDRLLYSLPKTKVDYD